MEDLTAFSSGSRERVGTGGRPEGWGDKVGRVGEGRGAKNKADTRGMWPGCWSSLSFFSYDKLHMSYKDPFFF